MCCIDFSHLNNVLDIGDWTITMKEEHGRKRTRTSTFVMESINEDPIDSKRNPGALTGLLVRNKYIGTYTI